MQPESAAFLWDVRRAADRVAVFIQGWDLDGYLRDELRRAAVERQLEIVGEGLKNLRRQDPETSALIPDIHRIDVPHPSSSRVADDGAAPIDADDVDRDGGPA